MTAVTGAAGLYVAGCVLLVVAGAAKVRRPRPARDALRGIGVTAPEWAVRLAGCAEVALGAVALAAGGAAPAVAVALAYAGFAAFVTASLRSGGGAGGCGCFGDTGAPVHAVQAFVDLAVAAAALAVAAEGGLAATLPVRALLVALGALVAWVAYLVMVPLPRLLGVVREVGR